MPSEPDLHVVLVEPEIPPNTGTIGRLCMATGSRLHLVHPLGFSTDDSALKRAGLDYWKEVDLKEWESFHEYSENRKPESGRTWYLSSKADREYWQAEFCQGDHLVFGPETRGLPSEVVKSGGESSIRIPMVAGRSLNLAVSAGIVVYEALRQIRRGGHPVDDSV